MFARAKFLAPFALLLLASCGSRDAAPLEPEDIYASEEGRDEHSYARPLEARVTHVSLDLAADFETRRMAGTATLDIEAADGADSVVLDDNGLEIESVTDAEGNALPFEIGENEPVHGAPLTVEMGEARRIVVRYSSAEDAPALQWLSPEQTAGGRQPYMFSQGQAILNRSWIPTQDSPGIRQTWDARITAPEGIRVVMSAEMLTPEGEAIEGEPGRLAYRFRMDEAVPPYLIAIAAGDIAFREIGPRSGVYAEPSAVDAAAEEFSDLEAMIDAAEELYGEYRWGRYDLLVLPPSFPYGGMENPRLTFVTPTIIAGDKSLVTIIAHELAHSWSGNLVTNATWNDFWLNEGFTTYFENRIMEAMLGEERAAMLAELGWADMMDDIEAAGGLEAPDTRLHLDLSGRDPDEGTTDIAYEKGAVFLRTVEQAVGRPRFDAWLRDYFNRNAFRPQTSAGLIRDMRAHLFEGGEEEEIGVRRWIYEPGLPENAAHVRSARFRLVDRAIESFMRGGNTVNVGWANWTTQERQRFLNGLPRAVPAAYLATLDEQFGLSNAANSEIRFAWLMLAIPNHYDPARASAERFLLSMGRRKFVVPLFRALLEEADWSGDFARRVYRVARPRYHAVTASGVDELMGGADG